MIKGIFCSLLASLFFGGLYYLATLLRPLSGESLFGIRMVVTLPFLAIAILLLQQQSQFWQFVQRLKREPFLILVLCCTSMIVGSQMWLFLYAPNSGRAMEVSIGYLLMPIAMVAFGKFIYKEHLSINKWLAIIFAGIGVLSNIILLGKLSWESVFVFSGYPIYFHLRRKYQISHIHSFLFEILLLIPISLYFISNTDMNFVENENPNIYYFIALLGLMSGIALISYTLASSLVPFNLLGLLGYVEPSFMLLISFLIGETLKTESYILMGCLSIAVALLIFDGILVLIKQRRLRNKNG